MAEYGVVGGGLLGGGGGGYGTITATGGTETTPGDGYKYHDFTSSGTFQITALGTDPAPIEVLLVGGGGGGGTGGGGGAEVVLAGLPAYVASYTVTVGAGGTGGGSGLGPSAAEDSTIELAAQNVHVLAMRGGEGGFYNNTKHALPCYHDGGADSGHGAGFVYGIGNVGGTASTNASGGGGGYGGAGSNAGTNNGGNGASGVTIWGYGPLGGGGGGGAYQNNAFGTGANGGDGQNATTAATDGTANTGTGGGGAYTGGGGAAASNGGSGRVVIRYKV